MDTLQFTKLETLPAFHLFFCSCPLSIPGPHVTVSCHLGCSGLRQLLSLPSVCVVLKALRSRGQVFCRKHPQPSLGLSGVFLMIGLGLRVCGKDRAEAGALPVTSRQGYMTSTWLQTVT